MFGFPIEKQDLCALRCFKFMSSSTFHSHKACFAATVVAEINSALTVYCATNLAFLNTKKIPLD